MKKRVLALVLTAAMVLGLTACGGSSEGTASTEEGTTAEATTEESGDAAESTEVAASTGEKI